MSTLIQRKHLLRSITGIFLLLVSLNTIAAELIGQVFHVNNGDTFKIWDQIIRLIGVDAPENSQTCKNKQGQQYDCGGFATRYLKELIRGQEVRCVGDTKDDFHRLLAVCYVDNIDINEQLVLSGWAVAFKKRDPRYAAQEELAKKEKRGIWQGNFVHPHQFRSGSWLAEEINTSSDCLIKGNINSKGDKIYHTPWGSKHYKRTKINTNKGERWFCSENEALAAGWRAPYR